MTALSYAPVHAPDGPWATYLDQIERVRPYLGHLERWVETLKRPKRCLVVDIPIEMDDGSVSHFEGFRVQHKLSRGPGKGGVRCDPARLSMKELERVTRRYTSEIGLVIGPMQDIPAPDVNTERHRIPLRTAAFVVACERVLAARELRGLYP